MSHSDVDLRSDCSGEDSCWDLSSLPSGNQPHRLGASSPNHAANPPTGSPPWPSPAYLLSSTASTNSTGSYLHTAYSGPGVSSILPRIADSASPLRTGTDSQVPTDPILLRFASHSTPPAGQISGFDSDSALSSGNIDSEDTGSRSQESNSLEENQTAETPNTSETGNTDEDIFALDEDPLDPTLNRALLFVGLEFPGEFIKVEILVPNCRCLY